MKDAPHETQLAPAPEDRPAADLAELLAARGLIARDAKWHSLGGGRSNRVWRVGAEGDAAVVKVTGPRAPNPLFPNDPAAEDAAMRALAGTGLAPDARCLIVEPGLTCLVYAHVPGRPWTPADDPAEAGHALARVHVQPAPCGLRAAPGVHDMALAIASELSPSSRARLGPIPKQPEVAPQSALLHGDPVPANVIVTGSGITGRDCCLIDWQCPARGNPAEDIALFLSPGMQQVYGSGPLSRPARDRFLSVFPETSRRAYRDLALLLHWRIAAYCLWRAEAGEVDYIAAAEAELAGLEGLDQQHGTR